MLLSEVRQNSVRSHFVYFFKKIGLLHQNEAHDSEFEYHEKEMDNSKLTSSWPSPFKTRYLRPDKCILESFNSD